MAFSALVDEVLESHKRSSRYGARVARIIVHHWAGTSGGVERLVQSGDPASANYIILNSGWTIGSVPEQFRAWVASVRLLGSRWRFIDHVPRQEAV